ncbi:MAG: phospholipase [Thermoanaerobaculia bacterium]|nr:phospholipase [Thermoanaerobaculia bacterium]
MAGETEVHAVAARTRGRYLLRPPAGEARGILAGFHGYAQDAAALLSDLGELPGGEGWAVASVDALHAFYARSAGGRPVRSWMTRDLREEAIADNAAYVADVLARLRERFGASLPIVLVGFSQGAAMAWRAALLAGHETAAVAALGGDLPPELGELPAGQPFPPRALLARGTADEWYTAERMEADRGALAARGTAVTTLEFPGGHEWSDPFRAALGELLAETAPTDGPAIR